MWNGHNTQCDIQIILGIVPTCIKLQHPASMTGDTGITASCGATLLRKRRLIWVVLPLSECNFECMQWNAAVASYHAVYIEIPSNTIELQAYRSFVEGSSAQVADATRIADSGLLSAAMAPLWAGRGATVVTGATCRVPRLLAALRSFVACALVGFGSSG